MAEEKAKPKKKHRGRNALIIVLCVVLLLGAGVLVLLKSKPMSSSETQLDDTFNAPDYLQGKQLNLLIAGVDWDETRTDKLTDVIIVANIDLEAGKINMLQIPRDTYVGEIVYTGKINALYNWGLLDENGNDTGITGINALASVINTQMKLPIDNYVMITMEGFKEAVDAMGGVEVTIDETITFSEEDIMEPGTYLLNGDRAELFVRWRGYSDADIGRMNVQRYFISGLIKKLDSLTTVEMISLVRSLYKYVESDLTVDEMITLASNVKSMSTSDMTMLRVPGEGVNGYGSMQLSVYSVHAEELADLLNTYMRPYSDPVPASELEVVEIQNTSSTWDDPNVATLDEYEGSGG